jgi:D,D-heptose 1,7-bisphosphate phosphatase
LKQIVILAGGKGTRLKEISNDMPKPMVRILGKPLLQHLIEQCVKYEFLDIKLLVSYKHEIIRDFFGDGSDYGVSIQYYVEDIPRGTAGALLDILPNLNEQFMVLYGDTFFDIDLNAFWRFHRFKGGDISIFLHPNDHPKDSDLIEIDSDLKVTNIHPYPHDSQWRRNLVNAALYIFNKKSLRGVSLKSKRPDIAKDLFPILLDFGRNIYGYLSTEYIKDMGTPNRLYKVERDITSGRVESLRHKVRKIAVFLDRDGVINQEIDHLSSLDEFNLIPGVGEAIRQANKEGILVVVVTNQPVIARGELSISELQAIHNKMDTLLGEEGAYIDRLYYCPHHTDSGFSGEVRELKYECDCRKPNIGMFLKAEKELNILLTDSWMIGDSTGDILSADRAGMSSILVETGYAGKDYKYNVVPDFVSRDLNGAIQTVLKEVKK